jgi:squalene-associated FAD-dependent desaturase
VAKRVIVIGGGLAGLTAAQALAERGHKVIVLESRNRLGGRAGSFVDGSTGQVIDACQHVSMGCCRNLDRFFRAVGVKHLLVPQRELWFQTLDGRVSRLCADPLPAPFHLARPFLSLHFLSLSDKMRIAYGLICLRFARGERDEGFINWLGRNRQSQRAIDHFWRLVLVSALNESLDRMGLKYARKVFVDAFLRNRRGLDVEVPSVPLDRLYGEEMQRWYSRHVVEIRLNAGVTAINMVDGRAVSAMLRDGEVVQGDWLIAAVPFDRLLAMLPADVTQRDPALQKLRQLQTSPIVSVHYWFDRPAMSLPHLVVVDGLIQWIFNRGEIAPGEWYLQVVISAARDLATLGHSEIEEKVTHELQRVLPDAKTAQRLRSRVVIEHSATISVVPGVDQLRPGTTCSVANLLLAGDWTNTGWPPTMESAVISGYRAAEAMASVEA